MPTGSLAAADFVDLGAFLRIDERAFFICGGSSRSGGKSGPSSIQFPLFRVGLFWSREGQVLEFAV